MTRKDWQNAFGQPSQSFESRVKHTVARLEAGRQPTPRPRAVLVLAAVLLLLGGAALALSSLGVLDILTENLRNYLLPGAKELVQQKPEQSGVQPEGTVFAVEEAVNDGRQVYLLVRVTAEDKAKTLLMDYRAEPAWGRDWWLSNDENAGVGFSTLASGTGRALVQVSCPSLMADGRELERNAASIHYDGEDVLYALTFEGVGGDLRGSLGLFANDLYGEGETRSWGELSLSVPMNASGAVYTAQTPLALPAMGGTLYALSVEQTPIATYVRVEYGPAADATDLQHLNFQDGLWYRWLDEQGEPVPDGNHQKSLRESDGRMILETAYRAFETLPTEIKLEFYNGMTKERFDTVTPMLTKEEK